MASSINCYTDQENTVPGGGGGGAGGRRQNKEFRGLSGLVQPAKLLQHPRSVLGEISNVARRQGAAVRATKQAPSSSFAIYQDEENVQPSSKPLHRSKASSNRSVQSGVDKENSYPNPNLIPHTIPVPKENSHPIPIPAPTKKKPQEDVAKKSISDPTNIGTRNVFIREQPVVLSSEEEDNMEEDNLSSPMVLDTTQSPSQQEWRVPPLSGHGETVDIFTMPEYQQDIYNYLRSTEFKHLAKWNYMVKQPDITQSMRSILVDWLVEVSEEYKLQTETLYLAVSYIDRFLSVMSVQRAKLQLVGTAAMFIASKYEEIYPPDVSEFVYITDDTYNKRQVLRMEHLVLKVLSFDVSVPTSHLFVSKISEMAGSDERTTSFAMYLNELSLMSGEFLQFAPSVVAAASVALARHTLGREAWPEAVVQRSGYTLMDLQACLLMLHRSHEEAENCPQQAIREKYRHSKHHGVSEIAPAILTRSL